MYDFFEIDFLDVGSKGSADAICMRYRVNGYVFVHVIDGGYENTGELIIEHINKYYGTNTIHNVIVTHNHKDHTSGLKTVLDNCTVLNLWMNKPWDFALVLLPIFKKFRNVEGLSNRLKRDFENLVMLENDATRRGIPVRSAFQGATIGSFMVMSPTIDRFVEQIILSDNTPDYHDNIFLDFLQSSQQKSMFKSIPWGLENLPDGVTTSCENEMSIVQLGVLCNKIILLTGDTGKFGLVDAASFAFRKFNAIPKPDVFQIPHHGSDNNVTSNLLDIWLGTKLLPEQYTGNRFTAYVCASQNDKDHPNLEVVRAIMHRNGKIFTTENGNQRYQVNAPERGWLHAVPLRYPQSVRA